MWPLRSTTCNIALRFYRGDFPRKAAEGIAGCVQWNKERGGREYDQLVMADILYISRADSEQIMKVGGLRSLTVWLQLGCGMPTAHLGGLGACFPRKFWKF